MPDHRKAIQDMFQERNRFGAFGEILTRMRIQGFQCHVDRIIDVRSPITAFCGLNGIGKSTLLQLESSAYQTPGRDIATHFNISDFMVVGTLDLPPLHFAELIID